MGWNWTCLPTLTPFSSGFDGLGNCTWGSNLPPPPFPSLACGERIVCHKACVMCALCIASCLGLLTVGWCNGNGNGNVALLEDIGDVLVAHMPIGVGRKLNNASSWNGLVRVQQLPWLSLTGHLPLTLPLPLPKPLLCRTSKKVLHQLPSRSRGRRGGKWLGGDKEGQLHAPGGIINGKRG